MALAIPLHVLAVVIWVGGMFFAHQILRPIAASELEPPSRLRLWAGVFARFFPVVWVCILVILATGLWVMFKVFGGFGGTPMHVHLMFALGLVMMAIFFHVFFAPYKRLKQAVAEEKWPNGAKALNQIRQLVGINMSIGLLTIVIGSGGRYIGAL